ncbi:Geranylgeranylglycerol-phosphategeranylgeranyltr ansferase [Methanolacinia petrolearia DSM 11571]|uniref:Digeranylgeranylglyceryl phosphate synthase n=1 Tax=Methanolacinia petrolearia (strain DSM 11571 / OCM 486 / SEBR 4847) TaxID=679926 RepID=E1RJQ0_METP4|nr:geranylgeranylglycerol-phosphate geranylgeranyltransferase [Methanolacinia petrolearia]ADN35697.1 Geranylgeranylglycerol-phosphategeranylgeranyltr ansferase [Methanolacinia petrolearia DSM 11571]
MSQAAYIRITRPVNSLFAGFAVLLGVIIAAGPFDLLSPGAPPLYIYPALITAVALITAAGNVINDYFDRDIDAVNRPDRPIPSGEISPKAALAYSIVLFIAGIVASLFTNLLCIAIAILNSALLALYASSLKGVPLAGNIAVSYLTASIFLFGGATFGPFGLMQNFYVALIVFLAILARELLKDAEDIEGDSKGGARTLPMTIGVKKTGILCFVLSLIAVIISLLPVFRWWSPAYLLLIVIADLVIMAGATNGLYADTPADLRRTKATSILKYGMFLSLVIFIASAMLIG